jgi:hypothetical protein
MEMSRLRFLQNPNTGEPFGTAVHPITADQQVFHTAEYPSHMTLPINPMPREKSQAANTAKE